MYNCRFLQIGGEAMLSSVTHPLTHPQSITKRFSTHNPTRSKILHFLNLSSENIYTVDNYRLKVVAKAHVKDLEDKTAIKQNIHRHFRRMKNYTLEELQRNNLLIKDAIPAKQKDKIQNLTLHIKPIQLQVGDVFYGTIKKMHYLTANKKPALIIALNKDIEGILPKDKMLQDPLMVKKNSGVIVRAEKVGDRVIFNQKSILSQRSIAHVHRLAAKPFHFTVMAKVEKIISQGADGHGLIINVNGQKGFVPICELIENIFRYKEDSLLVQFKKKEGDLMIFSEKNIIKK